MLPSLHIRVSDYRSGNSPTNADNGVIGYCIIQDNALDDALTLLQCYPYLGRHKDCLIYAQ